ADLPLRCQRTRHLAAFGQEKLCIRSDLIQAERRLVLPRLDLEFRELVPVDEDVGAAERRSRRAGAEGSSSRITDRQADVALREFAFDLEIELLREISRQINASATEPEPVVDCRRAEATFERENI